jgi:hypothetical protein
MPTEQLFQDLAYQHIEFLVRQLLKKDDWQFEAPNPLPDRVYLNSDGTYENAGIEYEQQRYDVVNQEVSFDRARIDVLATFNCRQRFAIVEVKAGDAGQEALDQLIYYINKSPMTAGKPAEHVVGILLAPGFVDIHATPPNVSLVAIQLAQHPWMSPTREPDKMFSIKLPCTKPADQDSEKLPRPRHSGLYDFELRHTAWIRDADLRRAFREVSQCFLTDSSPQSGVVRNPKGSHVAIQ